MKKIAFIIFAFLGVTCSKSDDAETSVISDEQIIELPVSSVDYKDMSNWVAHPEKVTLLPFFNLDIDVIDKDLQIKETIEVENNSIKNTGVDVFWVHPTLLSLTQNFLSTQVIPINEQDKVNIGLTVIAQGGLLSKYGRVYAPHYRQSSGITYRSDTDKEEQANVITTSYSDVKASFLDYLENYNNGNKIILAGHSQGSYLLAMLLRDVFDENPTLQNQLVVAALGGMGYVYAKQGTYKGGWWKNIPLCTSTDECGCISNWAAFDEEQSIPGINYGLPEFNPYLVNSGLVYRMFNEDEDWFVQDFSYYGETSSLLKNYITPNASYNIGDANFIAFDGLYHVRQKREGLQKVVLSLEHNHVNGDLRPNDLEGEKEHVNYNDWGYHTKDYHIYLWALMEQIDEKLKTIK